MTLTIVTALSFACAGAPSYNPMRSHCQDQDQGLYIGINGSSYPTVSSVSSGVQVSLMPLFKDKRPSTNVVGTVELGFTWVYFCTFLKILSFL